MKHKPGPATHAPTAGSRPRRPCPQVLTTLFVVACLGLLISCAEAPPVPVVDTKPELSPEQAFALGDFRQAALAWEQQAGSATGPDAASLRLRAADAWALSGEATAALDNLRLVTQAELTGADRALMNLVLADLALQGGRPWEAEPLLRQARVDLPESMKPRFDRLSTKTGQLLAQPGSEDISRSIALIESNTSYQAEQALQLLDSLEVIPSSELAIRSVNPRGNQNVTGWLDLALLIRQNLINPESLQQDIAVWKQRFPHHYLSESDALDLWMLYRQKFGPPRNVAVLLPGPGRLMAATEAIRDGILSAYLDAPGGAEILFLSTGEGGEQLKEAYFEALDQGSTWIIGPLQKPAVESLLGLPELVTPVLALNELPTDFMAPVGLAGQIHAISLSHEAETRALARQALDADLRKLIIIAPESEWGERTAQIFTDEFLQGNGQIMASARYLESENDHSATLERILKIDESKARKQQLENALQMKLEFEPIRRDDVDAIFLVANTEQGRSLRPQLRFHNAGDIPVYSPGRIFTGKTQGARDQDLNGIRFPITPLQLQPGGTRSVAALSSLRNGTFTPLYALGKDAWNLLPWLELMKRDPDFHFAGASGYFRIDSSGALRREPAFAIFKGGRPVPLNRASTGTVLR